MSIYSSWTLSFDMLSKIPNEILENIFRYVPFEDEGAFRQCSRLWYAIHEVHYKVAITREFNIEWQTLEEVYGKENLDSPAFIYQRLAFIKKWRMRGHAMPSIIPSSEDTSFCIFLKALPQEKTPDSQYLDDACLVGNTSLVDSLLQRGVKTTSNTREKALLSGRKSILRSLYPSGDALVQGSNESNLQTKLEKIFSLAAMRGNSSYIKYLHEELLSEIFRTHQEISLNVRSHAKLRGLTARNAALISTTAYLEKRLLPRNTVTLKNAVVLQNTASLNKALETLLTSYSLKELRRFLLPNQGELVTQPLLMTLIVEEMLHITEITLGNTDYIELLFMRLNFSAFGLLAFGRLNKERMMQLAISHNNQALIAELGGMNIFPSWQTVRKTILKITKLPFAYDAEWRLKLLKATRLREGVTQEQLSALISSKEIPSDALNIVIYIVKECLPYLDQTQKDKVRQYFIDQLGLVKGDKAPLIKMVRSLPVETTFEAIEILSLLSEWSMSKVEAGAIIEKINTLISPFERSLAEKKRADQSTSLSLSQNTKIVERNKPLVRHSFYRCSHSSRCTYPEASLLYVWLKHHNLQELYDASIVDINDWSWERTYDRDNFTLELRGRYLCGRAFFINAIIHNNLALLEELRAINGSTWEVSVQKVALIAILERLALAMLIPAVVILAALSTQNLLIPLGGGFIICLIFLFSKHMQYGKVPLISDVNVLREYSLSTLFSIAWGKKIDHLMLIDPQTDALQTDTLKASFQIQNLERQKLKAHFQIACLEEKLSEFQKIKEAFSGYIQKVGFFKLVEPSGDSTSILTPKSGIV